MKKLINDPAHVVSEMLQGMVAMYPGLARLSEHNVVVRSDIESVRDTQAAIISGGGSGHEPAHAGFVGSGMLSAAVAGEVFTSPPAVAVLAAIKAIAGRHGVLLIVKNYMGDRLNFGIAAEMARAEGIPVETVVVADDVALAKSHERRARRGLAGTVLVHKIAGGAAASGGSLSAVASLAQAAADDVSTIGLSLSAGIVPAVGKPSYLLGENEFEFGLGIHGEPGLSRTKLQSADVLAQQVIDGILAERPVNRGARVVLLVNNLGATTPMELSIFARMALHTLRANDIGVERVYCGTFISSLESAGVSLSLLPVDDERLRWLDAATSAPAWPNITPERSRSVVIQSPPMRRRELRQGTPDTAVVKAIGAACRAIIAAEVELTELDRAVGDGDLGINLARGAGAMLDEISKTSCGNAGEMLLALGGIAQEVIGGSSGPLYGVLLLRAGTVFTRSPGNWTEAVAEACDAVSKLGGAAKGDRTMLDALLPFAEALKDGHTFADALHAAEQGAHATAEIFPRIGRSSYLGERAMGNVDPGAAAVVIWLRAAIG